MINKNLDGLSIASNNYLINNDFSELQEEVKSLKQQIEYIKRREKKRSWKKAWQTLKILRN